MFLFAAGFSLVLGSVAYDTELRDFQNSAFNCLQNQDTSHPLFHGCVDWHSAVHAHWAVLRVAKYLNDLTDPLALEVYQRMNSPLFFEEMQYLKENGEFENPYGRTWLIRLYMELSDWDRMNGVGERPWLLLAKREAHKLLNNFEKMPPQIGETEYQNSAWVLLHLNEVFKRTDDRQSLFNIQSLIAASYADMTSFSFKNDFENRGFFSVLGSSLYLWSKAMDNQDDLASILNSINFSEEDFSPIKDVISDHQLGLIWSRAWAFKELSKTHPSLKDRFAKAFEDQIEVGFQSFKDKKEDYNAYAHWVPQFAIFALTEP